MKATKEIAEMTKIRLRTVQFIIKTWRDSDEPSSSRNKCSRKITWVIMSRDHYLNSESSLNSRGGGLGHMTWLKLQIWRLDTYLTNIESLGFSFFLSFFLCFFLAHIETLVLFLILCPLPLYDAVRANLAGGCVSEWHCGRQDQRRRGSMEDSNIISCLGDFGHRLG